MNKTVLVMARHDSTGLGVIRSLGQAGYQVHLLGSAYRHGALRVAAASRYVSEFREVVQPSAAKLEDGVLVEALLSYAEAHRELLPVVLFPSDDFSLYAIDHNRELLSRYFLLPRACPGGSGGPLTELMDKQVQCAYAEAAGLDVPWTRSVSFGPGSFFPKDIPYPCFCKHAVSLRGQKQDMALCRDEAALRSHLAAMAERYGSGTLLIQEYLEILQEYDLSGVSDGDRVILPGIIKKGRISRHEPGVTLSGTMLPTETIGEAAEAIRRLMRRLQYRGMFDLELNVTADRICFGEINFRSGGPSYAYRLCGANLPELAVKAIRGEEMPEAVLRSDAFGKTLLNERVAREDRAYGFLSRREMHRLLDCSDLLLLREEDDPRPEQIYRYVGTGMLLHAWLRRLLRRIKRS